MAYKDKILNLESLKRKVKSDQKKGKVVVHCHGCFDIIHPGHIRYLEHAKSLGDVLVVSLTADKFILKGDDRPYMPQELRLNSMAALEFVDYVYLDNESWAGPILSEIKPDIYVKGKEYESVFKGVFGRERKIIEEQGGKMYFSSGDVVFSSSQLIQNYKNKFNLEYEIFDVFCTRNKITFDSLSQLIEKFKKCKILVIGDVLVDEYIYSEVIDVSHEAPILTIRPLETKSYVGAAGVVAAHIKSLNGNASLLSLIGKDAEGDYLKSELQKRGVLLDVVQQDSFSTIVKSRYIGDNQKILKIDKSSRVDLPMEKRKEIIERIKKNYSDVDVIVFSDFAYGFVSQDIIDEVIKWANNKNIKVLGDVSGTLGGNILKFKNAFLITPTEKEARKVFDDKQSGLSEIANKILKTTGTQNIVITLGANGVIAFNSNSYKVYGKDEDHLESEYMPAIERNAVDSMGAGDAMLAMIALVVAAGGNLSEAVYLGNINSYLEVNKYGNVPSTYEELLETLRERPELF